MSATSIVSGAPDPTRDSAFLEIVLDSPGSPSNKRRMSVERSSQLFKHMKKSSSLGMDMGEDKIGSNGVTGTSPTIPVPCNDAAENHVPKHTEGGYVLDSETPKRKSVRFHTDDIEGSENWAIVEDEDEDEIIHA